MISEFNKRPNFFHGVLPQVKILLLFAKLNIYVRLPLTWHSACLFHPEQTAAPKFHAFSVLTQSAKPNTGAAIKGRTERIKGRAINWFAPSLRMYFFNSKGEENASPRTLH
jgi:hypothetical protein